MTWQLREYTVKPGEMQQWVEEWRAHIVPLREKHGFKILGAWSVDGTDQFVWIISYDGSKSWDEANAEYYSSPDRKAIDPDPARHLTSTQTRLMHQV